MKKIDYFKRLFISMIIGSFTAVAFSGNVPPDTPSIRFQRGELSNGMTLVVANDKSTPRVLMMIAAFSGSVDEPEKATGLAHYLEHMLFKGTDKISALDYTGEAPILARISELYEKHRQAETQEEKDNIYREIDELSQEAARYSSADEYSSLLQSIGASDINAFTSYDVTAYHCEIPVTSLEKYFILEAERFASPVFRRFHTELETVYEEFNRMQDSDERRFVNAAYNSLFRGTPYGRPVIGNPEDLKEPSLVELQKFYDYAYNPANMIVIASGDVDYAQVEAMAEKYLCPRLPARNFIPVEHPPLPEFTGGDTIEITGPGEEMVIAAYRFPRTPENLKMLTFFDAQLCYREIGRLDALTRSGKVLAAGSFVTTFRDSIMFMIHAVPIAGQTPDEALALLQHEVAAVAAGDYPEWLPSAVADNLYYDTLRQMDKKYNTASMILTAESQGMTIEEYLQQYDFIRSIDRDDFINFAAENIITTTPNIIKKLKVDGTPEIVRVPKPEVTPVPLNNDSVSSYAAEFMQLPEPESPEPVFMDFNTVFERAGEEGKRVLLRLPNDDSSRFSIRFRWDAGTSAIPEAAVAMAYWQKTGIAGQNAMTPEEIKMAWFRIGCHFSAAAHRDYTEIRIEGLKQNFERAIGLLANMVNCPEVNNNTLSVLAETTINDRNNNRLRPDSVNEALWHYAIYGAENPTTNLISSAAIRQLQAEDIAAFPRMLFNAPCTIMLYGMDDAAASLELINTLLPAAAETAVLPENRKYILCDYPGNDIFAVDFPGTQFRVTRARKGDVFAVDNILFEDIYNDFIYRSAYNTLREARALGYVAGSYIVKATYNWQAGIAATRVDCQADKLPEALEAVEFFDADPCSSASDFETAKIRYSSTLATSRPVAESIFDAYILNRNRGINYDPRYDLYKALPDCTLEDFTLFLQKNYLNAPARFVLMGEVGRIPESIRERYNIRILTPDEIFPE